MIKAVHAVAQARSPFALPGERLCALCGDDVGSDPWYFLDEVWDAEELHSEWSWCRPDHPLLVIAAVSES